MDIDRDVGDARALEHQQWVMDKRAAADFQNRLGRLFGERTQALAVAGREHQTLHRAAVAKRMDMLPIMCDYARLRYASSAAPNATLSRAKSLRPLRTRRA